MTLLRKFRRNVEDYGAPTAMRKAALELFGVVYRRKVYRLYRIDLNAGSFGGVDGYLWDNGWIAGEAGPGDRDVIDQVESSAEWLEGQLAGTLERGKDRLFVIRNGRTVVAFNVISFGEVHIPLIDFRKKFRPLCAWSEHIGVHPEYRRRGAASTLRRVVFTALAADGYRRLYGGCLRENRGSVALAKTLGFDQLFDITYRRLFLRFRWWEVRRAAP